jgi:N-acetyltransferase
VAAVTGAPGERASAAAVGFVDGAPLAEVVLEGAQVRLEPLRAAHVEGLVAAASADPDERFPFTFVYREHEGMRRWVEQATSAVQRGEAIAFATLDRRDGAVIGSTRFFTLDFWQWADGVARRPARSPDGVEIGYTWLARRAQRTAINTEAKLLMLTHAFEVWKVARVSLKTDARNQRSRDAIGRLGARLDGVLRAWQPGSDLTVRDTAMFSMLAGEWPEAKARLVARLAARAPAAGVAGFR